MKLVFPLLSEPLCFEENRVNVLIVEEPFTLRNMLKDLSEEINGHSGDYVLSVNNVPQEMSKLAEILIDPLHPETESKRLAGKMLKAATEAAQEHETELFSALAAANTLAAQISFDMRFPATFDPLEDPADFLKLFSFKLDAEDLDTPELLLEWMLMQREFFGKRLFILYGLKSYLSKDELSDFYRNAIYEKLDLLMIEPYQRGTPMPEEQVTIIDEDLCVIQ